MHVKIMSKMRLFALLPGVLLFVTVSLFSQDTSDNLQLLDQYIQKTMNDWSVPGLAIAVVKDGEIILSK